MTILVAPSAAYSHACGRGHKDVRLDREGFSVQHLKNRFQYYDICYAHAAADIVDAYRFHRNGDRNFSYLSSPLAAAIQNAGLKKSSDRTDEDSKSFEIGNICSTVNTLFKYGACSFKDVDRKVYQNVLGNAPLSYEEDGRRLANFFNGLHGRYLKSKEGALTSKLRAEQENDLMCYFKKHHSMAAETKGTSTPFVPDARTISKALDQKYYLDFLQQFMDGLCPRPIPLGEAPECKEYYPSFFKTSSLAKKVHSLLDQERGALPIGVDFCERVLLTGKTGTEVEQEDGEKCVRHATVIIGRREKDRRCQLLLKNTSFCDSIHGKYECEKGTGKVWVDEDDLLKSTYGLHYIR